MIRLGKYQVCVLDLVTDETGLSSTKIWRHVAYGVITYKFFTLIDPDVEWMIAYAAIIVSDAGFMAFLKRRYPNVDTEQPEVGRGGAGDGDSGLRLTRGIGRYSRVKTPGRVDQPGRGLRGAVRNGQTEDEGSQ